MQRARAAGVDPYTAIAQHFGMPPSILDTMMPGGPGWPEGVGVQYEHDEDYVPGEGHYTPPGEMPAGAAASLTRAQLVEVPWPGAGRGDGASAQVCINGRYYRAATQPAAHQSSAGMRGVRSPLWIGLIGVLICLVLLSLAHQASSDGAKDSHGAAARLAEKAEGGAAQS